MLKSKNSTQYDSSNMSESHLDAITSTTDRLQLNENDITIQNLSVEQYWDECLVIIKDNIDEQAFNAWFSPIKAKSLIDNQFTIQIPSQFYQEWIDEHYSQLLNSTLKRILGENIELIYEILVLDRCNESVKIQTPALKHPYNSALQALKNNQNSNLNPRYAFENFIVGESNRYAFNVAKSIAEKPAYPRFNPFFIYGGNGFGKTHLAQAIGNYLSMNNPGKRCLYISSEKFIMEFVEQATAHDNKKRKQFDDTYRILDYLIVDDIQFLAGKASTQDKFFHIFNSLLQEDKKIILTADRAPKEIKDIDNRLISRFIAGVSAEICQPDYNLRYEITKRKAADEGIELSNEIVDYIARNVTNSVREIEGVLINLIATNSIENKPISLELTANIIRGLTTAPKPITIADIKSKVAFFYNISEQAMASSSRLRSVAFPRQIAMYLIRKHTDAPLKEIGWCFGKRDHSTVLHSCRAIENYLFSDPKVKAECELLEAMLKDR